MTKKTIKNELPVVASVGVVVFDGNKVLLVKHGKDAHHFEGIMGLPAGKIEKNEKSISAAVRELQEETGLITTENDLELIPGDWWAEIEQKDGLKHFTFEPFWCKSWSGQVREANGETEPVWVSVDSLSELELLANVRNVIEVAYRLGQLEQVVALEQSKYRRALADYQNLERQVREDQSRFARIATQLFVEQMLMPFDHLMMAAKHINDKGLNLVIGQFKQLFESQGLREIEALGKKFDPTSMEAIEAKEGEEDVVLEVMQPGYELNGVVVRPAKVVVGKKS